MSIKRFNERKEVLSYWFRILFPDKCHLIHYNDIIKLILCFSKNLRINLLTSIPLIISASPIEYQIGPLLAVSTKKLWNKLYIITVMDKKGRLAECAYKNNNNNIICGTAIELSFTNAEFDIKQKNNIFMHLKKPKIDILFYREFNWNLIPIISNWNKSGNMKNIMCKILNPLELTTDLDPRVLRKFAINLLRKFAINK